MQALKFHDIAFVSAVTLLLWYPLSLPFRRFYKTMVATTTCRTELPLIGVTRAAKEKIHGTASYAAEGE